MNKTTGDLSSMERAQVAKLRLSIEKLLDHERVQKMMAQINKGQIVIEVREGEAVQIVPSPELRWGKELQAG